MNRRPATESTTSRQSATVIPPNVIAHVLDYADHRGIPSHGWFTGLGLHRGQLLDPQVRVSYHQARTILIRALRDLDEPGVGLRVGNGESLGSFGLLGLLMLTSATFGDAMRCGIENHRVCGALLDMRFQQVAETEVALGLWPRYDDPQLQPFLCEEAISSSRKIAMGLLGGDFQLKRVELTYAAPDYAPMYEKVLQAPIHFGATHNRAVVDIRWLAHPMPGHDPLVARQTLELCQAQMRQSEDGRGELVASVQGLLRDRIKQPPRIGEVAASLNLSERSLRRKLADSGHAYREILNEVRSERALELLRGGQMRVMDVADAIGFSDAREFRRAFKRWTGVSPRDVQRIREA